jgi:hypothetical protein
MPLIGSVRPSLDGVFIQNSLLIMFSQDSILVSHPGCILKPAIPAVPITTPKTPITNDIHSNHFFLVRAVTASIAIDVESAASERSN